MTDLKTCIKTYSKPSGQTGYQPPTLSQDLLDEFWRLEKEAEKILEGLVK